MDPRIRYDKGYLTIKELATANGLKFVLNFFCIYTNISQFSFQIMFSMTAWKRDIWSQNVTRNKLDAIKPFQKFLPLTVAKICDVIRWCHKILFFSVKTPKKTVYPTPFKSFFTALANTKFDMKMPSTCDHETVGLKIFESFSI